EPGDRPAGARPGRGRDRRLAGVPADALGSLPGCAAAVRLDVPAVLPAGELAVDLRPDADRRRVDAAGAREVRPRSAPRALHVRLPGRHGSHAGAARRRVPATASRVARLAPGLPDPVAGDLYGGDLL